ncbi:MULTISPECIES: hypothetical protein [unclassified Anabaena]
MNIGWHENRRSPNINQRRSPVLLGINPYSSFLIHTRQLWLWVVKYY